MTIQDYQEASRQRMLRLLKATGLYRLDGDSVTEKEIKIYAQLFGQMEYAIHTLTNNCFLETLDSSGVLAVRRLYGLPASMSRVNLQELARLRMGITNRDFTKEGVLRCLAAGGFQATLTENFTQKAITVTIQSDKGAFGTRTEAEDYIKACLPYPLTPTIVWPE